jgi:hypothetical protein
MQTCPACGKEYEGQKSRCECGADLTIFKGIDELTSAWFNRGVKAVRKGETGEAVEWFSAYCAAVPTDADARVTLAKVWAQRGAWAEAMRSVAKAEKITPDSGELKALKTAIEKAATGKKKRKTTKGKKKAKKKATKKSP